MSKKTFFSIIFVAFAAFLLFGFSESALAAKGIIITKPAGAGSAGKITVSDLGITDVGTLPSSRWYFFKEWGRGFERVFTFNSVKKAELELRITNEKAAEALKVQEEKPDDAEALATALKNYTSAAERLQTRFIKIRDTDNSPDDFGKLFEKLNEQTLKHAILFNQLAERWNTDPYTEDAGVVNPRGARDNHLQGAVDIVQKKIQDVVLTAAQKDKNIEQKAADQIARADVAIRELEFELAEFAINDDGVSNPTKRERTGPVGFDEAPARISTNMTIERQTPKRDFGDRMKAGLETAGGMLANGKTAFADGKFGEAFGQARSAEVLARNGLRIINNNVEKLIREGADADAPRIEDANSAMPIVPGTGKAGEKIVPEAEKRVFPETNNRVFPETNNRTACDDQQAPGCLRGQILECHLGKWVCIGPATGEGQILNPTESPSTNSNLLPAAGM
jgi:hypothetical protein